MDSIDRPGDDGAGYSPGRLAAVRVVDIRSREKRQMDGPLVYRLAWQWEVPCHCEKE